MMEKTKISVTRYKDNKGNPICAFNMIKGEFCIFHRTKKFGIIDVCVFDTETPLERYGDNGLGFLIPSSNCPLWKDK